MNNIYVDELPKSCKKCSFQCYGSCLCGSDILNGDPYTGICHLKRQKPTDCPLKSLKDALAEERKKVVQEIDCELYTKMVVYGDAPSYTDIHSILNKIKENSV